ncbi:MAG: Clp protease N-terminal domain-containing protein [Dehalococcoidia bacterium]
MGGAALGREPAAEEGRDDDAESPVEAEPADALRVTYEVGRPVSSDLLRLLDLAADEATRLDHWHVRPAHLLLALLEQSGPVRRAVREGGGDVDLLRGEVERYATEQDRLLRDLATARRAKDAAAADDAERAEAARRRELDLLERLRRLEQG